MFGLENPGAAPKPSSGKKKKGEDFVFDLEKEMKTPASFRKVKENIEGKSQKIKGSLRSGQDKGSFDTLGVLLHGYSSLLKVITRATKS